MKYTDEQWSEIVADRSLPDFAREYLEIAASSFLDSCSRMGRSAYRPPKKRADAWGRVAKLADMLCDAMQEAYDCYSSGERSEPPNPFYSTSFRPDYDYNEYFDKIDGLTRRIDAMRSLTRDEALRLKQALADRRARYLAPFGGETSESRSILEILEGVSVTAREESQRNAQKFGGASARTRVRVGYYRDVLFVWTGFGGKLSTSRSQDPISLAHVRGGPAVRFVRAVTGPVMGADAPSLEGIRDIIEREKKLREIDARTKTGQPDIAHPKHGDFTVKKNSLIPV